MHRNISKGTKDLLLFKMPMQEAIFWKYVNKMLALWEVRECVQSLFTTFEIT